MSSRAPGFSRRFLLRQEKGFLVGMSHSAVQAHEGCCCPSKDRARSEDGVRSHDVDTSEAKVPVDAACRREDPVDEEKNTVHTDDARTAEGTADVFWAEAAFKIGAAIAPLLRDMQRDAGNAELHELRAALRSVREAAAVDIGIVTTLKLQLEVADKEKASLKAEMEACRAEVAAAIVRTKAAEMRAEDAEAVLLEGRAELLQRAADEEALQKALRTRELEKHVKDQTIEQLLRYCKIVMSAERSTSPIKKQRCA